MIQEAELTTRKPLLAITGQIQKGKSTLLNCLLGGDYAIEGKGLGTTRYIAKYIFGDFSSTHLISSDGSIKILSTPDFQFTSLSSLQNLQMDDMLEISAWTPVLQNIDILDSPGYGANECDNKAAKQALIQADFIIYVLSEKTLDIEVDLPFLKELANSKKRFTIIFNCKNDINPRDDQTVRICKEIRAQISSHNLDHFYVQISKEYEVCAMNLLWAQCALGYMKEDEQKKKMQKICAYLEKSPTQSELLNYSGFSTFRKMIDVYVQQYLNWTPQTPLLALQKATTLWENSLKNILTESSM